MADRLPHYLGGEPLGPDAPLLRKDETCGDCLHPWWAHVRRYRRGELKSEHERNPPRCIGRACKCRREWQS